MFRIPDSSGKNFPDSLTWGEFCPVNYISLSPCTVNMPTAGSNRLNRFPALISLWKPYSNRRFMKIKRKASHFLFGPKPKRKSEAFRARHVVQSINTYMDKVSRSWHLSCTSLDQEVLCCLPLKLKREDNVMDVNHCQRFLTSLMFLRQTKLTR